MKDNSEIIFDNDIVTDIKKIKKSKKYKNYINLSDLKLILSSICPFISLVIYIMLFYFNVNKNWIIILTFGSIILGILVICYMDLKKLEIQQQINKEYFYKVLCPLLKNNCEVEINSIDFDSNSVKPIRMLDMYNLDYYNEYGLTIKKDGVVINSYHYASKDSNSDYGIITYFENSKPIPGILFKRPCLLPFIANGFKKYKIDNNEKFNKMFNVYCEDEKWADKVLSTTNIIELLLQFSSKLMIDNKQELKDYCHPCNVYMKEDKIYVQISLKYNSFKWISEDIIKRIYLLYKNIIDFNIKINKEMLNL